MFLLTRSVGAWGSPDFPDVLKTELKQLKIDQLPLQKAISLGSYVLDEPISVVNVDAEERGERIQVRAGIFFQTVIAGCNCADDPTPVEKINEYCEIMLSLDKNTALASVDLSG